MIYRGYLIKAFKNAYGVYAEDNSKNFCIRNSEDECMDFVDQMKREQAAASKIFGAKLKTKVLYIHLTKKRLKLLMILCHLAL